MYIQFSIFFSLFLSIHALASIDLCARFDDSVEESMVETLQREKPDVFYNHCFSNIYVVQNENKMILKGQSSGNATYLTVQDYLKKNLILSVPSQEMEEVLNQVCKSVLGCNYRYVFNSMLYDSMTQMPRKVKHGNHISEVFETDYRLFDLATYSVLNQKFVNRLILKSMQCRKEIENPCKTQMAPLFGDIDSSSQLLAFVLDVSGSMSSAKCFGMDCYDYMLASFESQLNKLDHNAKVQIYLYLDVLDKGKKLFPKPVPAVKAKEMMEYLAEKNLIKSTKVGVENSMGIEFIPTRVFFLDDLVHQDFDQVFIFSDFMDYRHQAKMYPDKMKAIDQTLEQWNKKLILRSYGDLRPSSHQFFSDYHSSVYLGHVE